MHHRPSATPRPHRRGVPARRPGRSRPGRLEFLAGRLSRVLVATAAVTAALLVVPVLPGPAESAPAGLDATSSSGAAGPPDSSTAAFPGTSPAPVATGGDPADPPVAGPPPAPVDDPADPPVAGPPPAPVDDPPAAPPAPVDDLPAAPPSTEAPTTAAPAPRPAPAAPSAPPAAAAAPAPPAAPAPSAAPAPRATVDTAQPGHSPDEAQVLTLVNAERGRAGCGPLTADPGLATVARAHSADMRDRGFFDHVNLDGLDPFDRADRAGIVARAENIAYGQADPAAVMTSWMNSPGHRKNILDCELARLGVGIAEGPGGPWWTQLFG